ncbi:MAG: hypothetical protein EZS28_009494 [Streblomastix strix]|uniref:Uncharacterized protein n=1 Tax=Streblomastix strix TaxID=222440 RepID=A0A5J4WIT2_9EUKA|nr:MAG: hypothetical protein EZS28_009494 [Streblomastix strix]
MLLDKMKLMKMEVDKQKEERDEFKRRSDMMEMQLLMQKTELAKRELEVQNSLKNLQIEEQRDTNKKSKKELKVEQNETLLLGGSKRSRLLISQTSNQIEVLSKQNASYKIPKSSTAVQFVQQDKSVHDDSDSFQKQKEEFSG